MFFVSKRILIVFLSFEILRCLAKKKEINLLHQRYGTVLKLYYNRSKAPEQGCAKKNFEKFEEKKFKKTVWKMSFSEKNMLNLYENYKYLKDRPSETCFEIINIFWTFFSKTVRKLLHSPDHEPNSDLPLIVILVFFLLLLREPPKKKKSELHLWRVFRTFPSLSSMFCFVSTQWHDFWYILSRGGLFSFA